MRRWFKTAASSQGLVLLLGLALVALAPSLAQAARPKVPNVVGLTLPQARAVLDKAGFAVTSIPHQSPYPGEHLRVYRQMPHPGTLPGGVGKRVRIWYYDAGQAGAQALSKVNPAASPQVQRLLQAHPNPPAEGGSPPGSTSTGSATPAPAPPPGFLGPSVAPEGSRLVKVPWVVGEQLMVAEGKLLDLGLVLQVQGRVEAYDPAQVGEVVDQQPPAGAHVPLGTVIKVRVFAPPGYLGHSSVEQQARQRRRQKARAAEEKAAPPP